MKFKATLAGLLLAGFALSAGDASAQPHRAGPSYLYPDPATTPGVVNPDITQANVHETICNYQWSTKSIRPPVSYTNHQKAQQVHGWPCVKKSSRCEEKVHGWLGKSGDPLTIHVQTRVDGDDADVKPTSRQDCGVAARVVASAPDLQ